MLQMLTGLLDYGEMQDGKFHLKSEPFRVAALADAIRDALRGEGAGAVAVTVLPGTPERIHGDLDRLRQALVHLTLYVLEGRNPTTATVRLGHDGQSVIGDIALASHGAMVDWKLDLLMGLSEIAPDQVTAEALRPLIARGLISAASGVLTLVEEPGGARDDPGDGAGRAGALRADPRLPRDQSAALATIYQAALRSERVAFVPAANPGAVDVVLVDNTSVGEVPLMSRLRARFPGALFVSLGPPQSPDFFDDIVETPNDMSRLRTSILGRLAS